MPSRRARILLGAYLVVLAGLTLIPVVGPAVTEFVVRLAEAFGAGGSVHTQEFVDAATNVVLFVPAGMLLAAAAPRLPPVTVWLICVSASVAIESAQAFVPGRTVSLTDVLSDALGAALGTLLAAVVRRCTSSR